MITEVKWHKARKTKNKTRNCLSYLPAIITFVIFSLLIIAARDNYGKHIIDLEERYHKEIHLYKTMSGAARNGNSKGL